MDGSVGAHIHEVETRNGGAVIEIVPLLDRGEFISVVAQWQRDEWNEPQARPPLAEFEECLRIEMGHDSAPIAYVALASGAPAGTVSLIFDGSLKGPKHEPWLASLYVEPAFRGRGIGRSLVHHAVAAAGAFGFDTTHLYSPNHEAFYRRLGWEFSETVVFRGRTVARMRHENFRPVTIC